MTTMTMKKLITTIGLLLLLQNAWAIDIRDAKAQGLLGDGVLLLQVRQQSGTLLLIQ
jgi:uncharacterized protein YdbL (DUF1318 family)